MEEKEKVELVERPRKKKKKSMDINWTSVMIAVIIVSLILYGLLSGEATLYDNNGNPVSIIPN